MYNVFEDVLPERQRSRVWDIKNVLIQNGALGANMSGTGPTAFGLFTEEEAARRALNGIIRAREALELGVTPDALLTDVEEALACVGELTGRAVREDITDRIFSKFCVGK